LATACGVVNWVKQLLKSSGAVPSSVVVWDMILKYVETGRGDSPFKLTGRVWKPLGLLSKFLTTPPQFPPGKVELDEMVALVNVEFT